MAKGVTIDLIVDPSGAVKGLNTVEDKSSSVSGVLAGLGGAAAAGVAALGTAAVAAAGALTAATLSAAAYADEILTTATNTNLSTEALQAYKYAAELIDVDFDTFVKSQGKFTKSMQDAARTGTGPAAEGFEALGLSVTDANGNLVDSETLYWQAIDALGAVENETLRTALAQQLFGKSGAEMNSIIAQGSEGFAALTEEARKNGAIMSGEQLEALGAFDDKMQSLKSTVEAAKNALGLTLLPVLDDLAGSGTSALGQFTSALLEADGDLNKAAPAFESLANTITEGLASAIPKILQVGTSLVGGLIQGIIKQAPQMITTAVPLLAGFVSAILTMLPGLLNAGLKIIIALVQGITASLPVLIPAAVGAVIGLVAALVDNLPLLLDAGIQLILGLALGLIEALPQLIDQIPVLITSVITALVGAIPQLVMAGVQLFLALIQNLPAIISGVITAVPQIVDGIVKTFGDPKFWKAMGDAGLQLIKGLWEGIKNAGDWLWRQISGFFGGVIDNIKGLLGIHSPSKVFADEIGGPMGDGVGVGFMSSLAHLKPQMASAVDGLSSFVQRSFDGSLRATAQATVTTQAEGRSFSAALTALAERMQPKELVIKDANGELIGRMQVEASGVVAQYAYESDAQLMGRVAF